MNGLASSFVLSTQPRFDAKWLKTDIQQCLTTDGLAVLWNELFKDRELTGVLGCGVYNSEGYLSAKGGNETFIFVWS